MGVYLSKHIKKLSLNLVNQKQLTVPTASGALPDSAAMVAVCQDDLKETAPGDKSDNADEQPYISISQQRGSTIEKTDSEILAQYGCKVAILKYGWRVSAAEAAAMELVETHTDIPSPRVLSTYSPESHRQILMTFVPGQTLETVWKDLERQHKERICRDIWAIIQKIRHIPRPPELEGLYLCLADGSPSLDPLIRDEIKPARPITSDDEVRARIYENYYNFGGRKYEKVLPDMLPRSSKSVFTHADIAPRNIMVDEEFHITGLLDWEMSGWFPDYWELANITGPAGFCGDWQQWMVDTAPKEFHCDIQGIKAARGVLF